MAGWRNREVIAHLCLQPTLLRKLIATAPTQHAVVTVAASLAATHSLARLVDASAHGCDLVNPVRPDRVAQAITAGALLEALAARAPHLVREARQLPLPVWIDVATGRQPVSGSLAAAVPVMT